MERYILNPIEGSHIIEYCGYKTEDYFVFQFAEGGELYYASQTKLDTLTKI